MGIGTQEGHPGPFRVPHTRKDRDDRRDVPCEALFPSPQRIHHPWPLSWASPWASPLWETPNGQPGRGPGGGRRREDRGAWGRAGGTGRPCLGEGLSPPSLISRAQGGRQRGPGDPLATPQVPKWGNRGPSQASDNQDYTRAWAGAGPCFSEQPPEPTSLGSSPPPPPKEAWPGPCPVLPGHWAPPRASSSEEWGGPLLSNPRALCPEDRAGLRERKCL